MRESPPFRNGRREIHRGGVGGRGGTPKMNPKNICSSSAALCRCTVGGTTVTVPCNAQLHRKCVRKEIQRRGGTKEILRKIRGTMEFRRKRCGTTEILFYVRCTANRETLRKTGHLKNVRYKSNPKKHVRCKVTAKIAGNPLQIRWETPPNQKFPPPSAGQN